MPHVALQSSPAIEGNVGIASVHEPSSLLRALRTLHNDTMMMKYASLRYPLSCNLGDEVQAIATEQFLPTVDAYLDRDGLANADLGTPHLLVLQGWFSHNPEGTFPLHPSIIPVFFGFHASSTVGNNIRKHLSRPECIAQLKRYEPIGCRDTDTAAFLSGLGIKAYFSGCLTLTLPERTRVPEQPCLFIVDAENIPLPRELMTMPKRVLSQDLARVFSSYDEVKRPAAEALLRIYREQATLVVTTKIHCALPCVAMGIPVILFQDRDDPRISVASDIGLPVYSLPRIALSPHSGTFAQRSLASIYRRLFLRKVDWNPKPLDWSARKRMMIEVVKETIGKRLTDHA